MSFYQDLSPYYDEIFAVDEPEMRFVSNLLSRCGHILDIGCGTGNKTVLLSTDSNFVTGVDQDGDMLRQAKEKNSRRGMRYIQSDMTSLKEQFSGERFDGVVCLGNTLVHLPSAQGIQTFLQSIASLVQDDGLFILQILNYDRILDRDIRELPVLETERIRFIRSYIPRENGLLGFATSLELKTGGTIMRNEIPLYPLRKAELSAMLEQAGFSKCSYHGSYQGDPLTVDSFVTIAVCAKA